MYIVWVRVGVSAYLHPQALGHLRELAGLVEAQRAAQARGRARGHALVVPRRRRRRRRHRAGLARRRTRQLRAELLAAPRADVRLRAGESSAINLLTPHFANGRSVYY